MTNRSGHTITLQLLYMYLPLVVYDDTKESEDDTQSSHDSIGDEGMCVSNNALDQYSY